jgi:hypothetical protein
MIGGKEMLKGSYLKDYVIETKTIIKIIEKQKRGKQGKDSGHPRFEFYSNGCKMGSPWDKKS